MSQSSNIHFEISERKILLRIFDVLSVLGMLYLVGFLFNFDYFKISKTHWFWSIVLAYTHHFCNHFWTVRSSKASKFKVVVQNIILTASVTVLFYLLTPFTLGFTDNRLQIVYFLYSHQRRFVRLALCSTSCSLQLLGSTNGCCLLPIASKGVKCCSFLCINRTPITRWWVLSMGKKKTDWNLRYSKNFRWKMKHLIETHGISGNCSSCGTFGGYYRKSVQSINKFVGARGSYQEYTQVYEGNHTPFLCSMWTRIFIGISRSVEQSKQALPFFSWICFSTGAAIWVAHSPHHYHW